jgi:hypothetical protein
MRMIIATIPQAITAVAANSCFDVCEKSEVNWPVIYLQSHEGVQANNDDFQETVLIAVKVYAELLSKK